VSTPTAAFRKVLIDSRLVGWSDQLDVVQQLIQVERLSQASPSAQATARFSRVVCAGHHHQRHPPPPGPLSQSAHERLAIHNRHVQIEDQRVWTVLAESRNVLAIRAWVRKRRRKSTIAKAVAGAIARGLTRGRDEMSCNPASPCAR